MSIIYGKGGTLIGSPIYGEDALDNTSPVYTNNLLAIRKISTFAGTQYGALTEAITFTGNFVFEAHVAITTSTAGTKAITGNTAGGNWFGTGSSAGNIGVVCAGFSNNNFAPIIVTPFDGKIHIWKLIRVGTILSFYIDEILQISGTSGVATVIYEEIGSTIGGSFNWIGEILSVKFTDQSGAEDIVTNIVFDSGSDLYQMPRGDVLSSELSGDPTCDNESYWDITNGTTFDGDGVDISYSGVFIELLQRKVSGEPLTVGDTIVCEINLSSYTSGGFAVYAGTTSLGAVNSVGTTYFTGVVATNGLIQLGASDFVGTVSKLSYKKLPDKTAILNNFALTDWNRYTLRRNIDYDSGTIDRAWLGDNIVVNGGFDADTDWTKFFTASIAGGFGNFFAPNDILDTMSNPIVLGDIYLTGFDLSGVGIGTGIGMTFNGFTQNVSGPNKKDIQTYTFKVQSTTSGQIRFQAKSGTTDMQIDNVFTQKILEVTQ